MVAEAGLCGGTTRDFYKKAEGWREIIHPASTAAISRTSFLRALTAPSATRKTCSRG